MFDLSGKIALVTGASRGLGRGIALCLAEAGADLVVNYRTSRERAGEVARDIESLGRQALIVQADVSDAGEVQRMFDTLGREYGRLDILVNNAGTSATEDIFTIDLPKWRRILDTNLTSTFLCAKKAMEIMREQRWGRIIQISSIVAHQGALFGHLHYASTKSAMLGFTKTLARTGARYGITVNDIAPGVVRTELTESILGQGGEDRLQELVKAIPVGRLGSLRDIGAAAVFLASDEAGFVTGTTIDVNGGQYMR